MTDTYNQSAFDLIVWLRGACRALRLRPAGEATGA